MLDSYHLPSFGQGPEVVHVRESGRLPCEALRLTGVSALNVSPCPRTRVLPRPL